MLILGLFTSSIIVGYFSIAKKIIDSLNGIAGIISQAIFPYVSKLINTNFSQIKIFLKNVGVIIGIYTFILGLILFTFSSYIIHIVAGKNYFEATICLKILAFVPMFIGINVPAVQILLGKGLNKQFSKAVLIGGIIDILLNFSLVPFFSYVGSCLSVILSETFVTIYLYLIIFHFKSKYNYEKQP